MSRLNGKGDGKNDASMGRGGKPDCGKADGGKADGGNSGAIGRRGRG